MKNLFYKKTVAVAFGIGLLTAMPAASDDFPASIIESSVWASAGGGTDTTNRYLAAAMQRALGVRINVVNRTGGGGAVAMNQVWTQPHDGNSWLGASEGMQVAKVLKYHTTGTQDWRWYIVGGSPGAISVRADSPYQTIEEFLTAARAEPEAIKIGHCAIGCVWHMKALALGRATDAEFNYIPFEGTAPAQVAVLTGEVDAVVSSISEQAEFVKSGKYRPLGMIELEPYTLDPVGEIAAIGKEYPKIADIPARQWLGMAIPKDTPADAVAKIDAAFEAAMQDPKILSLESERNMALSGSYGDEAEASLLKMEQAMSYLLYELGVAETNPADLGIEKP